MKLLLDTHVLVWWLTNDVTLPEAAREAIADASLVAVSAVSTWEISIKKAVGKLEAPDDVEHQVAAHGFTALTVTLAHGTAAGALPRHHEDPFDRMLVAQARFEDLTLVTRDKRLAAYEVPILAA